MQKISILALLLASLSIVWTACEKDPNPTEETPNSLTDSRDGQTYATVTIGTQTWMSVNLNYDVPNIWTSGSAVDTVNPNNPNTTYGRLYDWSTIMAGAASSSSSPSGVQGICPSGWHVPSDEEWNSMEIVLGMDTSATSVFGWRGTHGTEMKSTTDWNLGPTGQSGNGTNSSGFNAFPAGSYGSSFMWFENNAAFWSSTSYDVFNSWSRFIYNSQTVVDRSANLKSTAYSCRCVKD